MYTYILGYYFGKIRISHNWLEPDIQNRTLHSRYGEYCVWEWMQYVHALHEIWQVSAYLYLVGSSRYTKVMQISRGLWWTDIECHHCIASDDCGTNDRKHDLVLGEDTANVGRLLPRQQVTNKFNRFRSWSTCSKTCTQYIVTLEHNITSYHWLSGRVYSKSQKALGQILNSSLVVTCVHF